MGEPASSGSRAAASVLFVCMGNICRSPAAEGVMRSCLAARGLDGRVTVESAGTIDYHAGEPADARMRRAAAGRGHDLTSTACQVRIEDLERYDLIVAMDRSNLADLRELASEAAAGAEGKLRLLSDFLPAGAPRDVPDPYWGGERGFDQVLDMLEEACPRILAELLGDG
jgi:protein-tyrosine phosphatase